MPSSDRWPDAVLAGLACSMRAFSGPGALAARGRITGRLRIPVYVLTVGEAITDKTPLATDRTEIPALAGRVVFGAWLGREIADTPGLVAGAAAAAAGTYASFQARKLLVERTGWPDPAVAVGEDVLAYGGAAFATRHVRRRRPHAFWRYAAAVTA